MKKQKKKKKRIELMTVAELKAFTRLEMGRRQREMMEDAEQMQALRRQGHELAMGIGNAFNLRGGSYA